MLKFVWLLPFLRVLYKKIGCTFLFTAYLVKLLKIVALFFTTLIFYT